MKISPVDYTDIIKPTESSPKKVSLKEQPQQVLGQVNEAISEMTDERGEPTTQAYQIAVNKLNEFMDYNQKNSKFIFHNELERYYVEIVDATTQEVIKEIPPKELLDAYYKMQKLVGKMFDTKA
ncbi:flagellar protein FlaG [Kurthia sibirica]|uniref:Flagellar biosynthesis protein FlaG n=1 Tax=Kurthia sibirica TaxID=202750 RepID=A0A2U3AMQ9_9BACL|nr:flagellar protein FlaG [Kurthia sibirica]PWI25807.1 flagellar biosynthesis protein FlaG [Kurthia sibirica]GEK33625.1 hypothetical protein KSI01_11580 [Kurthia sibirica]